jgi:nucleoside-diphosphate-sugar epimerase
MNVLVIGGTRFLGLAIVRSLVAYGHHVIVAHRGVTSAALPEGVHEYHVDVKDRNELAACLDCHPIEAVIDTILNEQDLQFLIPLLDGRIARYLHCGSTGVYAPMTRIPAHENDPCDPPPEMGGFGSKLRQDRVLLDACRERGFPATILRPTNIYGPGDIPLDIWGGRDPAFFRRLQRNDVVTLPNDGRVLIQPGYVEELGEAFVQALESPDTIGNIYNISSAQAVTLGEYLDIIKANIGSTSPVIHAPMEEILERYCPHGKVSEGGLRFACEHMCVSVEAARRDFGYMPLVSLEEGLTRNVEWMRLKGLM